MQGKTEKWGIVVKRHSSTHYIERDSIEEVNQFFRQEHTYQENFSINNYILYPPYSNLTVKELFNYDITVHKPVRIGEDD